VAFPTLASVGTAAKSLRRSRMFCSWRSPQLAAQVSKARSMPSALVVPGVAFFRRSSSCAVSWHTDMHLVIRSYTGPKKLGKQ